MANKPMSKLKLNFVIEKSSRIHTLNCYHLFSLRGGIWVRNFRTGKEDLNILFYIPLYAYFFFFLVGMS